MKSHQSLDSALGSSTTSHADAGNTPHSLSRPDCLPELHACFITAITHL